MYINININIFLMLYRICFLNLWVIVTVSSKKFTFRSDKLTHFQENNEELNN
jgi:hypothetical protein